MEDQRSTSAVETKIPNNKRVSVRARAKLSSATETFLRTTGFEHGDADQTEGNHVDKDLLVKGSGALAMPGQGPEGVFEIAVESLDVPAQVIETGQF